MDVRLTRWDYHGAPKVQAKPSIGEILASRMAGKVHLDPEAERDVKLFQ